MPYTPWFEPRPYHTDSSEYAPEHRDVYHMRAGCPDGKRIEKKHLKFFGASEKQLCPKCKALGEPALNGLLDGVAVEPATLSRE